jgi:hypothetical protein
MALILPAYLDATMYKYCVCCFCCCLGLQTASKLQLVSAFVTAHTTAQQVMAKHLAESHSAKHLPHHSAPAGSDSHQQQQHYGHHQQHHPQQSGSPLNTRLGPGSNSSSTSASKGETRDSHKGETRDSQDGAAPSPPAVAVGDKEAEEVAQQVLRESRAEADAALRYAHEVRRVTDVRLCRHGEMTPQSSAVGYSCYIVIRSVAVSQGFCD